MITNASQATELARDLIADNVFRPLSGRKVGNTWIVKAKVGIFEKVTVTFEIPTDVRVIKGGSHF